jgi:hypothetical protein
MLGQKERWYFGFAVMVILIAGVLAMKAPNSLGGYAAVVGAIAVPLYGGALGKAFFESQNGESK